jgi:hypothetical protein
MRPADSVTGAAGPVFGDDGQVAGLSAGGQPHAQVGGTRPGHGGRRVTPGRLLGNQLAERRQVRWRGRREDFHRNDLS